MTFYSKYIKSFFDCILKRTYTQSLVTVAGRINASTAMHPHLHYYAASAYFYTAIIAMLQNNDAEALSILDLAIINYPEHTLASKYKKLLLSNPGQLDSKQDIIRFLKTHLCNQHLITEFEFQNIVTLWPMLKRVSISDRNSCRQYAMAFNQSYDGPDLIYSNSIKNYYLGSNAAVADLEKYVAINPRDTRALTDLARLLLMQSRSQEAIIVLNNSINLKPFGNSYLWLGLCYLFEDRLDDSLSCFEQAKKMLKNEHFLYHHALSAQYCIRAQLYHDNQHLDLAFNDLNRALELNSNDITALLLRAQIYAEWSNIPDAMADLDRILMVHPQHKHAKKMHKTITASFSR